VAYPLPIAPPPPFDDPNQVPYGDIGMAPPPDVATQPIGVPNDLGLAPPPYAMPMPG